MAILPGIKYAASNDMTIRPFAIGRYPASVAGTMYLRHRATLIRLTALAATWAVAINCRAAETKRPVAGQRSGETAPASAVPVHSDVAPRIVQNDTVSLYSPPWNVARVLGSLRSAGLSPAPSAHVVHSRALAAHGTAIDIRNGEIQLFIYGDANTAAAAATTLATIPSDRFYTAVSGPVSREMISSHLTGRPVVLSTDNLLAIVFSGDSSVHHKVRDALTRKHQFP